MDFTHDSVKGVFDDIFPNDDGVLCDAFALFKKLHLVIRMMEDEEEEYRVKRFWTKGDLISVKELKRDIRFYFIHYIYSCDFFFSGFEEFGKSSGAGTYIQTGSPIVFGDSRKLLLQKKICLPPE